MATYTRDLDGIERCTKRVPLRLSREEVAYCLRQVGHVPHDPDEGGGKAVDDFLADVLREAIQQRMRE